ncbi:glucan phosphoethanolaminetransferase (alkaline phosphatase superfamily) [Bacillus fengqiuensis]|nr:glucan phosphoethanolaminetransferase (alkaline phosphatase superfamily) [Bacillus fengqiuensis]
MILRKCQTAFLSSIIMGVSYVVIINLVAVFYGQNFLISDLFFMPLIVALYALPVMFTYGILTSILAEKLMLRFKKSSRLSSLTFHLAFGLVFPLLLVLVFNLDKPLHWFLDLNFDSTLFVWTAIFSGAAIIFWSIDTLLLKRQLN